MSHAKEKKRVAGWSCCLVQR